MAAEGVFLLFSGGRRYVIVIFRGGDIIRGVGVGGRDHQVVNPAPHQEQDQDALENLASIPQPSTSVVTLGLLTKPVAEYFLSWPALFLFAFDGVAVETCFKHYVDFYTANAVPLNRIPRAIVVNSKYLVSFCPYAIPNATLATPFDASNIGVGRTSQANRGYPLFWVMIELSKGLSWLSGMHLDYQSYYNEAFQ